MSSASSRGLNSGSSDIIVLDLQLVFFQMNNGLLYYMCLCSISKFQSQFGKGHHMETSLEF